MNINAISFRGVSIGHNLKQKIEHQKKAPQGFYKTVNYLNTQNNFDFEIKNARGKNAEISTYIRSTREQVGTLDVSIKDFEKDSFKVVKSIAKMIWGNNKVCQRVWSDRFKNAQVSDVELDDTISFCDDSKISRPKITIRNDK